MKKKTAYETPVIVPLGELARGSGVCLQGSVPTTDPKDCTTGGGAKFDYPDNCGRGQFALGTCGQGSAVGKKP